MKAAVLYGNEDIRYEEIEEPKIKEGYVKIRVMACGICGSDIPRVLKNGAHFYPIILGHEFSGYITETGDGVKSLKVGDHVAGVPLLPCYNCDDCNNGNYSLCKNYSFIGSRQQGAYSDYLVVPEKNAVKIDNNIPFEHAAFFEPSTVAIHGIMQAKYHDGFNVAVLGAGTIGIFTIQWLRILGAKNIAVFERVEKNIELAKRVGANRVYNTTLENFKEEAMKDTNNVGYDYVFEAAGNINTTKLAFELASNKSTICMIGTPTENIEFTPKQWEQINRKELYLTGSWMSYSKPFPGVEWSMTAEHLAKKELIIDDGLIHKKFSLSKANDAFKEFKIPGNVKGRIILTNED